MSNIIAINEPGTIAIKQAPSTIDPDVAKSFFPDTSEQLTEWKERFNRGKGTFNPNERVALQATVEQDEDGNPYLLTAQASCSADRLNPVGLSAKSKTDLLQFVGTTIAASVRVIQHTGRQFCHGNQYEIDPRIEIALLPFNPTREELWQLPSGSHVVIEGIVTNFVTYEEPEYANGRVYHTSRRGKIYISTGKQTITVSQFKDSLLYDKGELENLRDKKVLVGETVRLTAMVTNDHTLQAGYNRPYLLVPDPARLEAYNDLRHIANDQLIALEAAVANDQYQEARYQFAFLRQMELTRDEAQQAIDFARRLPEAEQPIFDHRYEAAALERAFGTNVEMLNKTEFMVFASQILTGVRENPKEKGLRTDQTYVYRFTNKAPFTPADTFELIKEMLKARIPRLEQCSDEHEDNWDDHYLIESSLGWLARTGHHEAFDELAWIVEYCLENGYFMKADEDRRNRACPRRFDGLLTHTFRAILDMFREDPQMGVNAQSYVQDWKQRLVDDDADSYVLGELRNLVPFSS